jgi:hypothetical protein
MRTVRRLHSLPGTASRLITKKADDRVRIVPQPRGH